MPQYGNYCQNNLNLALAAVQSGMSYRDANKAFNVPIASICNDMKGRSVVGKKAGRGQSIPKEIENAVVKNVLDSSRGGFPQTKQQVLTKIGKLVAELMIDTQFKNCSPGDKYWRCLKTRHPELTIRSPECCSHNRLKAMSEDKVNAYFDELHQIIKDEELTAETIWNMDESGIQFQHKPSKVVGEKGKRTLHARVSDSKEIVTLIACINAAGESIPPLCITKGKTQRSVESFSTYLGPERAYWTYQSKGWMENDLGVDWFQTVFLKNCGDKRPQILLMDSHSSHEVVTLLQLAKNERIILFALPAHTTQLLQPLDAVVFKPLKAAYNAACSNFMFENPGKVIDKSSFPIVLKKAWEFVMNDAPLLKKAFSTTGIYPPNRFAISPENFMSASILNRPPPVNPPSTSSDQPDGLNLSDIAVNPPSTSSDQPDGLNLSDIAVNPPSTSSDQPDGLNLSDIAVNPPSTSSDQSDGLNLSDITVNPPSTSSDQPDGLNLSDIAVNPPSTSSDQPDGLNLSELDIGLVDTPHFADIVSQAIDLCDMQEDLRQFALENSKDIDLPNECTEVTLSADWNALVNCLFLPPTPEPRAEKTSKRQCITSHRILTSDEVIKQKEDKIREKQQLEAEKNARKQQRLENATKRKSNPRKGPQPKKNRLN